jgi:hypothetical protein
MRIAVLVLGIVFFVFFAFATIASPAGGPWIILVALDGILCLVGASLVFKFPKIALVVFISAVIMSATWEVWANVGHTQNMWKGVTAISIPFLTLASLTYLIVRNSRGR